MEVNQKKCQYQGCNENVPQWAMYCQPHLDQVRRIQPQMQQPQSPQLPPTIPPMQQQYNMTQQPQTIRQMPSQTYAQAQPQPQPQQPQMQYPQQPRPIKRPELQPMTPIQIDQQQQEYEQDEGEQDEEDEQEIVYQEEIVEQPKPKRKAKQPKQRFDIPSVPEATRLEIKKASMQSACGIILSNEELMEQPYDQLILNIETLTVELYKIVVGRNENANKQ